MRGKRHEDLLSSTEIRAEKHGVTASVNDLSLFPEIDEILASRRNIYFWLRDPFIWAIVISLLLPLVLYTAYQGVGTALSVIINLIFWSLVAIGIVNGVRMVLAFSPVILVREHETTGFLKRNYDKIIMLMIGAGATAVFTHIIKYCN